MSEDGDEYEALPSSSTLSQHMFAGACAGIMEHTVMYPVDSVKTRMQCMRPLSGPVYENVLSGLTHLIRSEGISGSLRGIGAVIGGAGPAHALYFGCYEKMKKFIYGLDLGSSHLAHAASGACATLLHDAVMTPADAVKQRLQMYNSPYHNALDCIGRVVRNEGISALYRAYATQLSMNAPYQVIHFVVYEACQDILNPQRQYQPSTHVLSGAMAGCAAAAITNPLDVCKTLLNTQERCALPTDVASSGGAGASSTVSGIGLGGNRRGGGVSSGSVYLRGVLPHAYAATTVSSSSSPAAAPSVVNSVKQVGVGVGANSGSANSGGVLAVRGLVDAARLIYRLEGLRGFSRGVGARIMTSMPGTAISWSVYEYFKWYLSGSKPNVLLGAASSESRSSPPDDNGSGGGGGGFGPSGTLSRGLVADCDTTAPAAPVAAAVVNVSKPTVAFDRSSLVKSGSSGLQTAAAETTI